MGDLVHRGAKPLQACETPVACAYCGAILDRNFYFCRACATPYKGVEAVLPPSRPPNPTAGMLIEAKAPHVTTLFWTYFSVVVGVGLASHLAFGESERLTGLILQTAALFVTTCVFAGIHWRSLAVQFKRIGLFQPAALLAILLLVPLLGINYVYHNWLFHSMGAKDSLGGLRNSGIGEPALIVFVCVFPAILEEVAFRGLLQHWLQVAVKPLLAMVLAAALFTAMHFSILSAPYLFAVGMLLGWAKWKTGSLYPSILIHFLHNLIVLELF
jgi:membrane protease YdiL (CAAX protease family)